MARVYSSRLKAAVSELLQHPQIAHEYRSGKTHDEIADKYGVAKNYELSGKVSADTVARALKALLGPKAYARLAKEHEEQGRSKGGSQTRKNGTGVFGLKPHERKWNSQIAILAMKEQKKGIFKPEYQRGPTENNIRARGLEPWTGKEHAYFIRLCKNPEYKNKTNNPGCPDYKKISAELKRKFGTDRPPDSLNSRNYKMRHKNGER